MGAVALGLAGGLLVWATPAAAGWQFVPAGSEVMVGRLRITAGSDWNAMGGQEPGTLAWTHDGIELNLLEVDAVRAGQPLYRERRHRQRRPAPPVPAGLVLADLADLFESSVRAEAGAAAFVIDRASPARLGDRPAIELSYRFSLPDDPLERRGLARLAVVDGVAYAIIFSAPAIHYFDAGVGEVRAMMDRARF
ncbi:MAG: hypothetical protein KGL54_11580 [Sphingomonadales bacterium]|nr:hypothetical protein [Sphingomonadales bacterium]